MFSAKINIIYVIKSNDLFMMTPPVNSSTTSVSLTGGPFSKTVTTNNVTNEKTVDKTYLQFGYSIKCIVGFEINLNLVGKRENQ